jgi:hypothetical protein
VTSKLGPARTYAIAVMKSALKQPFILPDTSERTFVADVVGSVAQTIHTDPRYDVLEVKLQKTLQSSATDNRRPAATTVCPRSSQKWIRLRSVNFRPRIWERPGGSADRRPGNRLSE